MSFRHSLLTMLLLAAAFCVSIQMFAQETTGGLQGTVKDPTGAVVANAQIVVTSTTLIGNKAANSDASGYYRFANLPPGSYVVTVMAPSGQLAAVAVARDSSATGTSSSRTTQCPSSSAPNTSGSSA